MVMVEPVTTGGLVAAALAAGAGTMAHGALGAAARDLYQGLKSAVVRATGHERDVADLEANPDSGPRAAVLAEVIDSHTAGAEELRALAERLVAALDAEGRRPFVEHRVKVVAYEHGIAAAGDNHVTINNPATGKPTNS
jgi:epoxyqueuosine reductase QueG